MNRLWFLVVVILVGCEDKVLMDNGPCKFAGPELNYDTYGVSIPDSYFNFEFLGKKYAFKGNQLESSVSGAGCLTGTCLTSQVDYKNVFLQFRVFRPAKREEIAAAVGVVTPMMDWITHENYDSTSVPVAIQITNYCHDLFDPLTTGVSLETSYNKITDFELKEVLQDDYHYYIANYWLAGEFAAEFSVNGVTQSMTGSYKLLFLVEEPD